MKILFMGSGTFGLPVLDALAASRHPVTAVVTAPDKPQGRGRVMTPSPAKVWAQSRGIPVLTPAKLNTPETIAQLKSISADVFVVASYGALLSQEVLDLPPHGCINVHPSLLPRHRGASPVVNTLLEGDPRGGMTIMAMVKALDAGDILLQEAVDIEGDEDARELTDRLARLGGGMTVQVLDLLESGQSKRLPQDAARATYCSKLKKEAGRIDWAQSAELIHRRVRALALWPGTMTTWKGKNLRILKTQRESRSADGIEPVVCDPSSAGGTSVTSSLPGDVVRIDMRQGILVQTGDGRIWILSIQPEGGRVMDHRDFVNGSSIKPGARLGL